MQQLSRFDTQILALEDGRNHAHVSLLAIIDPAGSAPERLSLDVVRALVGEQLHLVAPLRWRLAEVPLALDYPKPSCWRW